MGGWPILLASCLALGLRLPHLGRASLWYDETVSAYLATQPLQAAIQHTRLDIHPPGYYMLLNLWRGLAGRSEFSLAYFSLVFGVLLIPLTYTVARRLFGLQSGLVAAWLSAVSAYGVWYSQEVRMYSLAACLGCLLVLATERATRGDARLGSALLWGLLAALSLYVLYYLAFLVAFLGLFWFVLCLSGRRSRVHLRHWLAGQGMALLLYIPWLPIALRQALEPPVPPWRSAQPLALMLRQSALALSGGEALPERYLLLAVALCALALLAPWLARRARSSWSIVGSFAFPCLSLIALSLLVPLFHPRYLFAFSPLFLVSVSAIASWPWRRLGRTFSLLVVIAFSLVNLQAVGIAWSDVRYQPDDLRGAVHWLQERWVPGDVIFVNAGYAYTALLYYWQGPRPSVVRLDSYRGGEPSSPLLLAGGSIGGSRTLGWGDRSADFYPMTLASAEGALSAALAGSNRLWQFRLYDTVTDPAGDLRQWLATNAVQTDDYLIPGPSYGRVQAFQLPIHSLPCDQPWDWSRLVLTCGRIAEPSSGKLPVYLALQVSQSSTPVAELHYTLRLEDSAGKTVAQLDGPLLSQPAQVAVASDPNLVVRLGVPLSLPRLAQGVYTVSLGLYRYTAGQLTNLEASPPGNGPPGTLVQLGTALIGG